ncbi:unnamed protein product [Eruca vesicaria subsp. sativa]|uniref:Uncharacterized protein n=1 Tax=Eruca vesicaria subsp. sativa TaxID=29727 RepID=A0ABC8M893_ERUVS|nr:unnamed protein product [Eruca vesicaria subsp. sativa]
MPNLTQARDELSSNRNLPIARSSSAFEKETRNEVLITHDLPNAGGTQLSPLIMPNLTQTRDELSSNRNSPIARSSSAFERGTQFLPETEWNNIQRVGELSGIRHNHYVSPSTGFISNKRIELDGSCCRWI